MSIKSDLSQSIRTLAPSATRFKKLGLLSTLLLLALPALAGITNPQEFWSGASNNSWQSISNWNTTAAGGVAGQVPFASTDVYFDTTTPVAKNLSTNLNGAITINSLTFTSAATSSVTIAPGAQIGSLPGGLPDSGTHVLVSTIALTINGGGITVQDSSAAHTISANVILGTSQTWKVGPTTGTNTAGLFTVSGAISQLTSGTSLTKTGTGTLLLTGNASYNGATNVNAGTLQIGNGVATASWSSSAVTIASGATLAIDLSDTNLFSTNITNSGTVNTIATGLNTLFSNISGSGDFLQSGTGKTVLFGTNSYSGTTTVSKGTLEAGNSTAFSPNSDFVVNKGATLNLAGNNSTIAALNDGSAGGGIVTNNNGTILTSIGGGSGSGGPSVKGEGATILTISGGQTNADSTFGGVIKDGTFGPLALTKTGQGTLTLNGINTYTGITTINSGNLVVNGSIAGSVTLDGGTLGGHGTIKGSVTNDDTLAPGAPAPFNPASVGSFSPFATVKGRTVAASLASQIGTLTISGNYVQGIKASLNIQILSASAYDKLHVGGTATLGGALNVQSLGYTAKPGDKFTIITAGGGITGNFGEVNIAPSLVLLNYVQSAKTVVLEATQNTFANAFSIGSSPGPQGFNPFGLTPNQIAVALDIDKALSDPRLAHALSLLDSVQFNHVPLELDRIAPEELAALFSVAFQGMENHFFSLEQRLADLRASAGDLGQGDSSGKNLSKNPAIQSVNEDRWGFFITETGNFTGTGGTYNASGYDVESGGTALGADIRLDKNIAVGLTLGYAHTNTDITENGRIKVDGGRAGVYGMYEKEGFYAEGFIGGGYNSYDIHRTGLGGPAVGSTSGGEFDAAVNFGYDIKKGGFTFTPLASLLYTDVGIDGYTEQGSLLPLNIASQNESALRSRLGVRASYAAKSGDLTITPYATAQWQHSYQSDQLAVDSSFANGAGSLFTVHGPQVGRDSILLTTGVTLSKGDYALYLAYQAELARDNYSSQTILLGLRVAW